MKEKGIPYRRLRPRDVEQRFIRANPLLYTQNDRTVVRKLKKNSHEVDVWIPAEGYYQIRADLLNNKIHSLQFFIYELFCLYLNKNEHMMKCVEEIKKESVKLFSTAPYYFLDVFENVIRSFPKSQAHLLNHNNTMVRKYKNNVAIQRSFWADIDLPKIPSDLFFLNSLQKAKQNLFWLEEEEFVVPRQNFLTRKIDKPFRKSFCEPPRTKV